MATPEIPYTIPKLVKGKRITTVPKGSTWAKEEAKQNWYVEFFFHNPETDKMERFRSGIVGNIISGQVTGSTAKKLSETFGMIMQDRTSLSINSSDTSISKSSQLECAISASKISSLSSGEFIGIVADNPDQKIKLKVFHSEIQNDHEAIRKEEESYRPIPIIKRISDVDIQENYMKIKSDIENLFKNELGKLPRGNNAKVNNEQTVDGASISM
jgi:hypothetical protein